MSTIFLRVLLCAYIGLAAPLSAMACDVCGSAVNTGYYGILPQYRRHFAGVRYQAAGFSSRHLPSLFENSTPASSDRLHKAELWGRFYPTDRWQLFAFVPYQVSTQTENGIRTRTSGIGDISFSANYIFLNTGDSGRFKVRNFLSAGAGLKLPTGRYDAGAAPGLQTGTGSWDFLFNLTYTVRYKKAGINTDLNARINTTNSADYTYGNMFAAGTRFFYWYSYRNISLLPHLGLLAEYTGRNLDRGFVQKFSGGSGLYASAGTDLYWRKIGAGVSCTIPVSERLYEGLVTTNSRLSFQVIYLF